MAVQTTTTTKKVVAAAPVSQPAQMELAYLFNLILSYSNNVWLSPHLISKNVPVIHLEISFPIFIFEIVVALAVRLTLCSPTWPNFNADNAKPSTKCRNSKSSSQLNQQPLYPKPPQSPRPKTIPAKRPLAPLALAWPPVWLLAAWCVLVRRLRSIVDPLPAAALSLSAVRVKAKARAANGSVHHSLHLETFPYGVVFLWRTFSYQPNRLSELDRFTNRIRQSNVRADQILSESFLYNYNSNFSDLVGFEINYQNQKAFHIQFITVDFGQASYSHLYSKVIAIMMDSRNFAGYQL